MTIGFHNLLRTATAALAALLLLPGAARATNVRDIAHLQGARENKLTAVGMVVGLKGTGDGSKNVQALRSLAAMLQRFRSDVQDLSSINADNAALVSVVVTVPENGARQGQKANVQVAAINGAKSLKGGRLLLCPMFGPLGPIGDRPAIYALSEGAVSCEDPASPTTGVINGGAIFEQDFVPEFIVNGRITLVIDADHSSWAIASTLATVVNDAEAYPGHTIATAVSPGNVVVTVPTVELTDPADFIARVLSLPVLMPDRQARIVINERTGTIVLTDDVEIDPVIISHPGLTISTITPEPVGTPDAPVVRTYNFVALDPQNRGAGTASLQGLLDAFNQLQVPPQARIEIVRKLHRTGRLHATVIEE